MRPALSLLKLTDRYELKARLMPALLSCLVAAPGIASAFSASIVGFIASLSIGGGMTVVSAVGLAYLASMAGRAYERKLWPRWPYDAPTNLWLHPDDNHCSTAQKRIWYEAIRRHVKLDIQKAIAQGDDKEIERVINDAVVSLRHQFRLSEVEGLLAVHNEDYGFARNLAGLRVVWGPVSITSFAVSWSLYFAGSGTWLGWGLIASLILGLTAVLYFGIPTYVRQRADRYAESFFGCLMALKEEASG